MSFLNLYLVKPFPEQTLEREFIAKHRQGSLPYVRLVCGLAIFADVAFLVTESLDEIPFFADPAQFIRLFKLAVLVGILWTFHRRMQWVQKYYVPFVLTALSTLIGSTAALVLTYSPHLSNMAPWPITAALITGTIVTYGFRLPVGLAALISACGAAVLIGVATYLWLSADLLIHMTLNFAVTNALGIGLVSTREMRERKGFLQNIEIENARAAAEREAKVALEATRAKTHVLSAVAHDLRQPMMGLMAHTDTLRNLPTTLTLAQVSEQLQAMQTTVAAMDAHLQTLLDLSQTQLSNTPFVVGAAPLAPVLRRIRAVFLEAAHQQGVSLRVLMPRSACWGEINEQRLFDLLSQLVWNAVKYARIENNARPRVIVGLRRTADQRWRLLVADNGLGMNAEIRARMFEEYFQSHVTERSRRLGGYGLGMSQVQAILRRLPKHALTVRSEPNRGTCFCLTLPRVPPTASRPATINGIAVHDALLLQGRYVLLVEDRPDVCAAMTAALRSIGLLVDAACDFAQAIQMYERAERDFDLLLTDYELDQKFTGAELVRALRERRCEAAALLITANHDRVKAEDRPLFDQVLLKPLPIDRLAAACAAPLRRALQSKPS